jgi:hypothetical protein
MIEDGDGYLRCVVVPDDSGKYETQRMIQMPGKPGWFMNEKALLRRGYRKR